jgi:hypothetical protein
MEYIFLTIKDEQGILRPMAGIWKDNENGRYSAGNYKLEEGEKIVKIKIEEIS